MSRGHGRIQLQVLDFLLQYDESARAHGDREAFVSITAIAGKGASRSRIDSVRRAALSLVEEGLILVQGDDAHRATSRHDELQRVNQDDVLMVRVADAADVRGQLNAS